MQKNTSTDKDNGDNACAVPQSELIERLGTEHIAITDQATQEQMAAVMLLHGTPEQQKAALEFCSSEQTKYRCWQMHTVRRLDSASGYTGCLPVLTLPKSMIGKTVKVTIEECT